MYPDISKEQYEKVCGELKSSIERSGKRSRTVMCILRICGIVFIAGAVFAVFRVLTGFIICMAAAAVYTAVFYAELRIEKREQLETSHMVYTKRAVTAIAGCQKAEVHTSADEEYLNECFENETDSMRKCMLGTELFRLMCDNGEFAKGYDVLSGNKSVYTCDEFYEFLYNCCMLRYYVNVKKSGENDEIITETYAVIQKIFEKKTFADDFLFLVYAAESAMIMSYYREDYLKCIEYGEIRLSRTPGVIYGMERDRSTENFRLMYAECLYYAGKYELSREICGDMRKESSLSPYLKEKADELWELLN